MIETLRNLSRAGWLLGLAAWLILLEGRPLAQESGPNPGVSTDPADKAECKRQLNRIYGAIAEYRKQHGGKPPDRLSDLNPDYIHNPKVLVCPFVQKRGGLRTWKKRFTDLASDPYTSYSYEFPPVPVGQDHWRGLPKKTVREIKEREAELLGSVVPIVRCHDHFPWLNLSLGGPIYESETVYWERNWTDNEEMFLPAKLFPGPVASRPLGPKDFPPRDPSANPRLLDLTAWYNATLTNSWQGFGENHLASLPTGIREFDGYQFDVRGVIQLAGTELPAVFPAQVAGIQVAQKCARIHFLHALSGFFKTGNPQASYSMHYTDGEDQKFTLFCDQQIADWWYDPRKPAPPSEATVAWTGQNEAAKAYGMALRLYHAVWENPRKDAEIESITFEATVKQFLAGPFVVAITLE